MRRSLIDTNTSSYIEFTAEEGRKGDESVHVPACIEIDSDTLLRIDDHRVTTAIIYVSFMKVSKDKLILM